jgi:hypothetical protein
MEINGPLVCFGVILIPGLVLGYASIRKSKDKSKHLTDKVGGNVFPGENPEVVDTHKKSYSLSEEIRKLWKYN